MPDAGHGSKTEHDFCPGGGGTVNQYSESEVGGLTLSDWDWRPEGNKIVLEKYKGDQVNVVIPSEFDKAPGKSVEIATFEGMFDNLKKEDSSGLTLYCNELVSLKIGTTDQKVTLGTDSLQSAFSSSGFEEFFTKLESIDLSGLDTSEVSDMSYMFVFCINLKNIKGLETLDTSKVRDLQYMFSYCSSLESLDLSHFNTELVNEMGCMFMGCRSLENINVNGFVTNKVQFIYMRYIFFWL